MKKTLVLLLIVALAATPVSAQMPMGGVTFQPSAGSNIGLIAAGGNSEDSSSLTIASQSIDCTGANTIVVASQGASSGMSSVTDSSSNTYSAGIVNSTSFGSLDMTYAQNATVSSTLVVTVTFAGATTFRRIMVWCLSNASTSAALDTSATLNSATGVSPVTTANITPAASGGIIIVAGTNNDGTTCTFTANNSFTLNFGTNGVLNGVTTHDTNGMYILGATGSTAISMSMSALGGASRMVAMAFKK